MNTPKRRALLLRNPASRRGGEDLSAVLARLNEGGVEVEEAPQEREPFLQAAKSADLVIVAGGDGALHHAAPLLLESGLPLGVLPMGTANDLARSLGVGVDLIEAAEIMIAGHLRHIDLGDVNGAPFFNVASIGVSVELARELTSEIKQRFGSFSYVIAGLRALVRARRFAAIIESAAGSRKTRTFQISVGNGRYYGGGMSVHEACEIGDGKLYLYSLGVRSLWRLVQMAFDFRAGAHGAWADVRTETGERFVVRTRRRKSINADGEIIGVTPAVFTLRRRALRVFAPPASPPPDQA